MSSNSHLEGAGRKFDIAQFLGQAHCRGALKLVLLAGLAGSTAACSSPIGQLAGGAMDLTGMAVNTGSAVAGWGAKKVALQGCDEYVEGDIPHNVAVYQCEQRAEDIGTVVRVGAPIGFTLATSGVGASATLMNMKALGDTAFTAVQVARAAPSVVNQVAQARNDLAIAIQVSQAVNTAQYIAPVVRPTVRLAQALGDEQTPVARAQAVPVMDMVHVPFNFSEALNAGVQRQDIVIRKDAEGNAHFLYRDGTLVTTDNLRQRMAAQRIATREQVGALVE